MRAMILSSMNALRHLCKDASGSVSDIVRFSKDVLGSVSDIVRFSKDVPGSVSGFIDVLGLLMSHGTL